MYSSKLRKEGLGRARRNFVFLVIFFLCGGAFYYYYPQISFYLLGNVFLRLENHAQKIEEDILSSGVPEKEIFNDIKRIRELSELSKEEAPLDPLSYYYVGLLNFYELCLRLDQGQDSLLFIAGRGFLPEHKDMIDLEARSILPIVKKVLLSMRRALALQPDFLHNERAHTILSYVSLLFTGRTDLRELERIQQFGTKLVDPSPLLARVRDWTSLAFYAQLGRKKELYTFMKNLRNKEKETKSKKKGDDEKVSIHPAYLSLDPFASLLILCYTFYQARDYIGALRYARSLEAKKEIPPFMQLEALRMQAEIIYLQRGKQAAKGYFDRAYAVSEGKDSFIKTRIEEIYP